MRLQRLMAGWGLFCFLAGAADLRIGIVGDQTGVWKDQLPQAYDTMTAGVKLLAERKVRAILHTGDLLETEIAPNEQEFQQQFTRAAGILSQAGVPWYLTPGDHDVNPPGDWNAGTTNTKYRDSFQQAYAKVEPRVKDRLYYSFDIDGYHFVALQSLEVLRTDPRWSDVYLAQVSEAQYQWLQADLREHRRAKGIVVFTHHPLWYNWTGWSRVHELLRQYPVRAVVAGHFHYAQDEGKLDGIRYLVVGATGAGTKQGNAAAGKLQHVTVMTLSKADAQFELVPVGSSDPAKWPPRRDMDRVQALDVLLSPKLVPSCLPAGSSETMALRGVGNPLDTTLDVEVAGASLSYADGACLPESAPGHCLLRPAWQVSYVNNSGGYLQSPAAPLAKVKLGDGTQPLKLTATFRSTDGTYQLERSLTIKPCAP